MTEQATEDVAEACVSSRPEGLSARMEKAALLEARGYDSEKAGKELGVSGAAVRHYRQNPAYREAVRAVRDEIYTASLSQALAGASRAVTVLEEIMNDSEVEPQHRIRAASVLMSQTNRGHDVAVMGEKLDEVRRVVGLD